MLSQPLLKALAQAGGSSRQSNGSAWGNDHRHRTGLQGAGALNNIADLEREAFALEINYVIDVSACKVQFEVYETTVHLSQVLTGLDLQLRLSQPLQHHSPHLGHFLGFVFLPLG